MGLVQKTKDVVAATIKDQHQTAINCENMDNDLLMVKKTTPNGIIRNGSVIIVNPGQMAVLIDNGKVLDAAAEQGAYEWQSDASASFFSGDFGGMFGEMWKRFSFGGATYQDQAVYFINAKEITDNRFGTPIGGIPCTSYAHARPNEIMGGEMPMSIKIKASGKYTFMITRPDVFLGKIGGTPNIYFKDELIDQMRSEVLEKFQKMVNVLLGPNKRISPMNILSYTDDIKDMMREGAFDLEIKGRGTEIRSLTIENITPDDESFKEMKEFEKLANTRTNIDHQLARNADVMKTVGSNEAGIGVGFLGLGMMNQVMGGGGGQGAMGAGVVMPPPQPGYPQQPMYPQPGGPQQPMAPQGIPMGGAPMGAAPADGGALCTCGQPVTGKFCAFCGAAAPVAAAPTALFCTECGTKAGAGKFCAGCGAPLA